MRVLRLLHRLPPPVSPSCDPVSPCPSAPSCPHWPLHNDAISAGSMLETEPTTHNFFLLHQCFAFPGASNGFISSFAWFSTHLALTPSQILPSLSKRVRTCEHIRSACLFVSLQAWLSPGPAGSSQHLGSALPRGSAGLPHPLCGLGGSCLDGADSSGKGVRDTRRWTLSWPRRKSCPTDWGPGGSPVAWGSSRCALPSSPAGGGETRDIWILDPLHEACLSTLWSLALSGSRSDALSVSGTS